MWNFHSHLLMLRSHFSRHKRATLTTLLLAMLSHSHYTEYKTKSINAKEVFEGFTSEGNNTVHPAIHINLTSGHSSGIG